MKISKNDVDFFYKRKLNVAKKVVFYILNLNQLFQKPDVLKIGSIQKSIRNILSGFK